MAKFIVTSGANYQPFSYQELAAPVAQAAELHRQTQDAYDAMSMETAALQSYIENEEKNSIARKMYDNYQNQLSTLQENLWANGYNAQTRRDLYNAKNGFSSNILRLQQAVKDRQERSIEYHNMKLEHPDMVMGDDPGLASLDSYITNDRFGRDYFTYSGNALTNEVGTDAKARMKELFDNPELAKLIPGYNTLITNKGATSAQVAEAIDAISQKYGYANVGGNFVKVSDGSLDAYAQLDGASKFLADILDSHIASTGASGRVSDSEFGRLLGYGSAGLSQAVGEPTIQNEKDWMLEQDRQFDIWKKQQGYTAALKASMEGQGNSNLSDTNTRTVFGPSYEATKKLMEDRIKPLYSMITLPDGTEIKNNIDASAVVFSEDKRMEWYKELGFDIALDPPKEKNPVIVTDNGTQYELYYDKNRSYSGGKGAIVTRPVGDRGIGNVDENRSRLYHQSTKFYNDTKDYYEKYYRDIYKAADIDPKTREKYYKNSGNTQIPMDVNLRNYEDYVWNLPENAESVVMDTYVAKAGSDDANYREKFGQYLAGEVDWDKKGNPAKVPSGKGYEGQRFGIHRWDYKSGTLSPEPITNYKDILEFDKDDKSVTNIREIYLPMDAINNNYIVFQLTDGSYIGVGVEMFRSDRIKWAFKEAQDAIAEGNFDYGPNSSEAAEIRQRAAQVLAYSLRGIMGYDNATTKAGATKSE